MFLTLHALVWWPLRRAAPCASSCLGSGCCWAGWPARTRPCTSVSVPGGPPSWLNWSWVDERNPRTVLPDASLSGPGKATAYPVLYWHVHPEALILSRHYPSASPLAPCLFSSSAQASSLCGSPDYCTIRSAYVCWHMLLRLPALWFKISIYSYNDKGIPLIPL